VIRAGFRFVLRLELSIYVGIWRWLTRRPSLPGTNPRPFAYVGVISFAIWVFIVLSAIEIPAAHLLLPWEGVKPVVLILGVWGLTWMVGYLAGLTTYPHVVSDEGLRVRSGPLREFQLPWPVVEDVLVDRRNYAEDRGLQILPGDAGPVMALVMSNRTNVTVRLGERVVIRGRRGRPEEVVVVRFWADDPEGLVEEARSRGRADSAYRLGQPEKPG
jgi:hypothetical protein